jgi:mycofactocin precursor
MDEAELVVDETVGVAVPELEDVLVADVSIDGMCGVHRRSGV